MLIQWSSIFLLGRLKAKKKTASSYSLLTESRNNATFGVPCAPRATQHISSGVSGRKGQCWKAVLLGQRAGYWCKGKLLARDKNLDEDNAWEEELAWRIQHWQGCTSLVNRLSHPYCVCSKLWTRYMIRREKKLPCHRVHNKWLESSCYSLVEASDLNDCLSFLSFK